MTRPPRRLGLGDRRRGAGGNAVRLVERQLLVEHGIAGRRDAGGMGERGEADAALPPGVQRAPVERKAGRRRLERHRVGGDRRPHVPQRQRLGDVRVLDRPAVPRQPGQDMLRGCPRSAARQGVDGRASRSIDGGERAEPQAVARRRAAAEAAGLPCACGDRRRRTRSPRSGSDRRTIPSRRGGSRSARRWRHACRRGWPARSRRHWRRRGRPGRTGSPARRAADDACGRPPRR